ncbi:MAG: dockerin type I domain-containing protein [Planctomycetota bacterium]
MYLKKLQLPAFCFFSLTLVFQSFVLGQGTFDISFVATPSESVYSYSTSSPAAVTISPGGTVSLPGSTVEFSSFAAFQADVVGQWSVLDAKANEATFDIVSFVESDFPTLDLLSPMEGDQFPSATFVPFSFNSTGSFQIFGTAFDGTLISVQQFLTGISGTLEPGVLEAPVVIDGLTFRNLTDLISNIDTSQVNFDIDSVTGMQGNLARTEIVFFINSILGDVNRDGVVNLLDVAPFVELLSSGEYQFEADINGDGLVNLLDVAPFEKLLGDQ